MESGAGDAALQFKEIYSGELSKVLDSGENYSHISFRLAGSQKEMSSTQEWHTFIKRRSTQIEHARGFGIWFSLHFSNCSVVEAHKRGINPGFETQGTRYQKSKTEVSVAPLKGLVSCKNGKKNHLFPLIILQK